MRPVALTGIALWSPGAADLEAFARGASDPSVTDPASPWVPARSLRGTSRLTRMLGHAAAEACARGGADPARVATVYASGYGEIETMVTLLEAIFAGDGQVSPMRFKNSVHNAASGLGAIGTHNTSFSTAIAAGDRTFEAAMIEALGWLEENGGDLVVAVADDALPEPLAAQCAREGLCVGLCLSAAEPAVPLGRLSGLRAEAEEAPLRASFQGRPLAPPLATNPAAAALPLLAAILERRPGRVPLALGLPRPWSIEVSFA